MRLLAAILSWCCLSACGVTVSQLGEATLSLGTAGLNLTSCEVSAYIPPLDEEFVTTGIRATVNGKAVAVQQGEAARDVWTTSGRTLHEKASGIVISTIGTNAFLAAPQPPFIELEIFDNSGRIHVRVANPCALDELRFEEPTRASPLGLAFGPAFRPGETITLVSDERGSWGSEPVAFILNVGREELTIQATPNGNRLTEKLLDMNHGRGFGASASRMTWSARRWAFGC